MRGSGWKTVVGVWGGVGVGGGGGGGVGVGGGGVGGGGVGGGVGGGGAHLPRRHGDQHRLEPGEPLSVQDVRHLERGGGEEEGKRVTKGTIGGGK